MSSLHASVPDLLLQRVQKFAAEENVALDQIVTAALSAYVSGSKTRDTVSARASRVIWKAVDEMLSRVLDIPPVPEDELDWRPEITDADEIKALAALDGPDVTWRTASAVARHTGLSEERVAEICSKYDLKITRVSEVRSVTGSLLVGLIENVGW